MACASIFVHALRASPSSSVTIKVKSPFRILGASRDRGFNRATYRGTEPLGQCRAATSGAVVAGRPDDRPEAPGKNAKREAPCTRARSTNARSLAARGIRDVHESETDRPHRPRLARQLSWAAGARCRSGLGHHAHKARNAEGPRVAVVSPATQPRRSLETAAPRNGISKASLATAMTARPKSTRSVNFQASSPH